MQNDTRDLALKSNLSIQTEVSFVDKKFESFIVDQEQLERSYKKEYFENWLKDVLGNKEETGFIPDVKMKKVLQALFSPIIEDEKKAAEKKKVSDRYKSNNDIEYDNQDEVKEDLKIKIAKLIQIYAKQCKKLADMKTEKRSYEAKNEFLKETCTIFKEHLQALDSKYSR